MCKCGCNTCDITKSPLMLNESLAPKQILSEGLKYHMDNNKPLTEHVYRAGSENYFNLWAEARSLYSREILEITNPDDLEILTETHLGHFGVLEDGNKVPLDFPMEINEAYYTAVANLGDKKAKENLDSFEEVQDFMDKMIKRNAISVELTKYNPEGKSQSIKYDWDGKKWVKVNKTSINEQMDIYDEIANMEFGMDYDQLGPGEKEWVQDEIDNMPLNEVKKDIYDKFLDNPQNPKGRAKTIISKFLKQYGEGASQMAVDRFAKQNNLKPEEKYILKYITKQDIKISSQPGGPNLSVLKEVNYTRKGGNGPLVNEEEIGEFPFEYKGFKYNVEDTGGMIDGYGRKVWQVSIQDKNGDVETTNVRGSSDREGHQEAKKFIEDELLPYYGLNEEAKKKLNKPMRDSSGGKAYKVYVKDPKTGNIKTVRFGSGGLKAKINDPKARQAFAKRHKCSTKKDKTKASYWSCRLPRYAKLLGLKSNFTGFW